MAIDGNARKLHKSRAKRKEQSGSGLGERSDVLTKEVKLRKYRASRQSYILYSKAPSRTESKAIMSRNNEGNKKAARGSAKDK